MSDIRVRFAPSPTGYLHIGGARTALFNWLFARRHKGVFILRIEDTDEVRSTEESVSAILDSMRWLGLDFDEGPTERYRVSNLPDDVGSIRPNLRRWEGLDEEVPLPMSVGERPTEPHAGVWGARGDFGPYFQMERLALYQAAVEKLLQEGKAYRCYCSKEDLDAARQKAQQEKRPVKYDGRCRGLSAQERGALEAQGKKFSVRLRMPDSGETVVEDIIRGRVAFDNALLQDFVIQKASGGPTYNFACVVDDHRMGITDVIRGDEHLSNTPLQLRLYEALGIAPPRFAHLSMILGPDGAKLSKRHGATSVLEYKAQGYLPEAMRNYLALLGWSTTDSQQLFEPRELVEKFDLSGCQKSPATFDTAKLQWLNGTVIRKLPKESLLAAAEPFLKAEGLWEGAGRERILAAVGLEQEKYSLLTDVPKRVDFFFKDVVYDPKAVEKVLRKEGVDPLLEGLEGLLSGLGDFTQMPLEAAIRGFCAQRGVKAAAVFHPLRVAVSGRTEGATLFVMLELLGKEKVLERLGKARKELAVAK